MAEPERPRGSQGRSRDGLGLVQLLKYPALILLALARLVQSTDIIIVRVPLVNIDTDPLVTETQGII